VKYRNTSATPSPATRMVGFQVSDGTASSNRLTRAIAVTPVDDAPVLTRVESKPLAYKEQQPARAISASITIGDADDTNLAGATVKITNNYQRGSDFLSFANTKRIRGAWNAVAGTLTLTGVDTLARYQAALRSVKYRNTSPNPGTALRSVSFLVTDGAATSSERARMIAVKPINDRPVLRGIETKPLSYVKNQTATAITATIQSADVDNTILTGATVQITRGYQRGQDVLAFIGTDTIKTVWDTKTGTLTLRGNDTVAAYQAALRAVTYQNASASPSTAQRTVTFQVSDGRSVSRTVARSIRWRAGVAAAASAANAARDRDGGSTENDAALATTFLPLD